MRPTSCNSLTITSARGEAALNEDISRHPACGAIRTSDNLSEYRIRIAAPRRMRPEIIRGFVVAKLPWIRQQQRKVEAQQRETEREYLDRESHYVFGKRRLLNVIEADVPPSIE